MITNPALHSCPTQALKHASPIITGICPCGSTLTYINCCQPLHLGKAVANSPQQLMGSRYCAFVMDHIQYLLITHAEVTRDSVSFESINQWNKQCEWRALQIVTSDTDMQADRVEFIAWYKESGKLTYHHELSQFSYLPLDPAFSEHLSLNHLPAKAWFYHSASYPTRDIKLPSRNDACVCNSGKKFKKCCA